MLMLQSDNGQQITLTPSNVTANNNRNGHHSGYSYSSSTNGDSYALVQGDWDNLECCGWMSDRREDFQKARKMAKGDFLYVVRGGKSYVVDDPAMIGQIHSLYEPMESLGKQQEELGRQQEALGAQQEELGRRQEQMTVNTPDMTAQIAQVEKALAELKSNQGKAMTQEQFGELQGRLADLQGRLGALQGEAGSRQGELGSRMGELGAKQGKLGAMQGKLGAEQGRLARAADEKVKSMIDESLKNGKARPVQ